MSLKLYDPTVEAPSTDATPAPRPASLDGRRIGLLANGKVNADRLLRETARRFEEQHGCTVVAEENKRGASTICPPDLLGQIGADVDFMITAVGD